MLFMNNHNKILTAFGIESNVFRMVLMEISFVKYLCT
jgi:hypothetical protein